MISILGPIGLSYIHYKDTKILLFPELHAYGTDEDKLKSYDKPLIKIEDLYIITNLCRCSWRYRYNNVNIGGSSYDRYAEFISARFIWDRRI